MLLLARRPARPRLDRRSGRSQAARPPAAPSSACRSTMREMSSRSSMSCACALVAALDRLASASDPAPHPASPRRSSCACRSRVDERRAELVRQRRQELILRAVRLLGARLRGLGLVEQPLRAPLRRACRSVMSSTASRTRRSRRSAWDRTRPDSDRTRLPSARELALDLQLLEALVLARARARAPTRSSGTSQRAAHELVEAASLDLVSRGAVAARGTPRWRTRRRASRRGPPAASAPPRPSPARSRAPTPAAPSARLSASMSTTDMTAPSILLSMVV